MKVLIKMLTSKFIVKNCSSKNYCNVVSKSGNCNNNFSVISSCRCCKKSCVLLKHNCKNARHCAKLQSYSLLKIIYTKITLYVLWNNQERHKIKFKTLHFCNKVKLTVITKMQNTTMMKCMYAILIANPY